MIYALDLAPNAERGGAARASHGVNLRSNVASGRARRMGARSDLRVRIGTYSPLSLWSAKVGVVDFATHTASRRTKLES
jgi:hypothetical protein